VAAWWRCGGGRHGEGARAREALAWASADHINFDPSSAGLPLDGSTQAMAQAQASPVLISIKKPPAAGRRRHGCKQLGRKDKLHFVIPAQTGIHCGDHKKLMNGRYAHLDSRLRGNDDSLPSEARIQSGGRQQNFRPLSYSFEGCKTLDFKRAA
jgi:hypothetical protein